jgi:hypothetical protein
MCIVTVLMMQSHHQVMVQSHHIKCAHDRRRGGGGVIPTHFSDLQLQPHIFKTGSLVGALWQYLAIGIIVKTKLPMQYF